MRYIRNVLVATDRLLNALAGGTSGETISSRCGKRVTTCKFCTLLCRMLDKIDPRHCETHIKKEQP